LEDFRKELIFLPHLGAASLIVKKAWAETWH